mgnify:CR=1 FL=1|jgi:DNA-binding FadR family transcriptional regulator
MAVAKAGHNVLIETFYHLSRELLFDIIVEVIEKPTVKEEGSQFHKQLVEAIEKHDVEAGRLAAFKTMQHLKEKMGIG